MGKYHINLEDLESIGAEAINSAMEICDVLAIDEFGLMELFSEKFKDATHKALESKKLVNAVLHGKAQDKLVTDARNMEEAVTYTVSTENRNELSIVIAEKQSKPWENRKI